VSNLGSLDQRSVYDGDHPSQYVVVCTSSLTKSGLNTLLQEALGMRRSNATHHLVNGRASLARLQLVRRAEAAGMSLRAYVVALLRSHASMPTLDDWLDEARTEPLLPAGGPDSVTLVEEGRRDSDVA
jgi:hypothetical protein